MLNYSKCLEENLHEKLKFWKKFKYWHQHFVPKKKAFPQADTKSHKQTQNPTSRHNIPQADTKSHKWTQFLKQANKGEKQTNNQTGDIRPSQFPWFIPLEAIVMVTSGIT